jgi:hypothetical protein
MGVSQDIKDLGPMELELINTAGVHITMSEESNTSHRRSVNGGCELVQRLGNHWISSCDLLISLLSFIDVNESV